MADHDDQQDLHGPPAPERREAQTTKTFVGNVLQNVAATLVATLITASLVMGYRTWDSLQSLHYQRELDRSEFLRFKEELDELDELHLLSPHNGWAKVEWAVGKLDERCDECCGRVEALRIRINDLHHTR